MASILGYVTGGLTAIGLITTLGYAVENPFDARSLMNNTQSTLHRRIEQQRGYIGEGNLVSVVGDAIHDLGQRNVERAVGEFRRLNIGIEHTPYQDGRLASARWGDSHNIFTYLKDEAEERLSHNLPYLPETKGELALASLGLCAGLGLLGVLRGRRQGVGERTGV